MQALPRAGIYSLEFEPSKAGLQLTPIPERVH